MAAVTAKKAGLPGGGWLSMAPECDDVASRYSAPSMAAAAAAVHSSKTTLTAQLSVCASAASRGAFAVTSAGGIGAGEVPVKAVVAASTFQAPSTPARRLGRTATFQVGAPDSSKCASPIDDGGGASSYYGSTRNASPVAFDVRSSFAPMPKYGNSFAPSTRKRSVTDDDDDGHGITYAGRRWKGNTAHAVELEMEELGDRSIMSYAPDAVYLASRLEGLKRNLEASGGWRKPRYIDYDEETDHIQRQPHQAELRRNDSTSSLLAQGARTPSPLHSPSNKPLTSLHLTGSALDDDDDELASQEKEHCESSSLATNGIHLALSEASRRESTRSSTTAATATPASLAHRRALRRIDWHAKQAALDSRLDIRMLRRPDLEQVRELHCLHGDADKTMDFDTYTTSAGFLIRLLVDEKHVCLVAVAKPLPEPAPLPSGAALVPHCPPPSLDLPPSKAQYLLAGRGIGAASPYLGAVGAAPPTRFSLGAGWEAPGTAGPPPSVRSRTDEETSSGTTPPDSLALLGVGLEARLSSNATGTHKTPPTSLGDGTSGADGELRSLSTTSAPPKRRAFTDAVLAGPTNAVAPPRAIRVMGAPPPGRRINVDAETILGVASATISTRVVPPTDVGGLWPGIDTNAAPAKPHHQAHILTLAVAHSERGQGLGARLLDALLDECKRRACALASKNRRRGSDAGVPFPNAETLAGFPMHTTLEVHASNESALQLYYSRGFQRVKGARGVRHQFYQGDPRVPKTGKNGSDAWVLEHKA